MRERRACLAKLVKNRLTLTVRALRDEKLAVAISQVRDEVRGIYGAPKTFMRLRALGVRTSRKHVARIMRERGWRGVTCACAKRPSGEKRASKRESALDLVGRRFEAGGPDAARFADIAHVKTRQGWLYPALATGMWSRRIAGWSMGPSITAELADEALKMALVRRNPPKAASIIAIAARNACRCFCPRPCGRTASGRR